MINRPDMTPFKKRLLGRGYLSKVSFPGDRVEAGVTTVIASKSMVVVDAGVSTGRARLQRNRTLTHAGVVC